MSNSSDLPGVKPGDLTQPDFSSYHEWLNWMLTWPQIPKCKPWTPPEQPRWWPPYPENRRLPLRTQDV